MPTSCDARINDQPAFLQRVGATDHQDGQPVEPVRPAVRSRRPARPTGKSAPWPHHWRSSAATSPRVRGGSWERQALCKAHVAVGEPRVTRPRWRPCRPRGVRASVAEADADEIRRCAIGLSKAPSPGATSRSRGSGGIVDIALVQMLQLKHGRRLTKLRCPSTLGASLAALHDAGCLAAGDYELLAASYRFLRTLEGKLRLMNFTAKDSSSRRTPRSWRSSPTCPRQASRHFWPISTAMFPGNAAVLRPHFRRGRGVESSCDSVLTHRATSSALAVGSLAVAVFLVFILWAPWSRRGVHSEEELLLYRGRDQPAGRCGGGRLPAAVRRQSTGRVRRFGKLLAKIRAAGGRGELFLAGDPSYMVEARKRNLVAEDDLVARIRPVLDRARGDAAGGSARKDDRSVASMTCCGRI